MNKKIKVPLSARCPCCGTEHSWDISNSARPFCSERCKLIDLGKWANEAYRVEQCDHELIEEASLPPVFRH